MTDPSAFGLTWDEAELEAGWQGVRALRFQIPPPPAATAHLIIQLARGASGIIPEHIQVVDRNGAATPFTAAITDGSDEVSLFFTAQTFAALPRGRQCVTLLSGGDDPLHPFFGSREFDFFIDCPSGDCRSAPAGSAIDVGAEPSIDLAVKDYGGFLTTARNWIAATSPDPVDLSPASFETTLLELVAHHADMLSLHQDRVVQEAFVDTARERISLSRHARFIGLELDEGAPAQTLVAIDIAASGAGYLPARAPIERRDETGRVSVRFETTEPVLLDRRWNAGLASFADGLGLRAAAWPGAMEAVLPAGASEILLWGWALGLTEGQRIALIQGGDAHHTTLERIEEIRAPGWVDDPGWGGAPIPVPSATLSEVTRLVFNDPTTGDFLPFADPAHRPFLITANLVSAAHGTTVNITTGGDGPSGIFRDRRHTVYASDAEGANLLLRALRTPEGNILTAGDQDKRPALSVRYDGENWNWQPNLRLSSGFDRHFTTERENDGSIWILFGDGRQGAAIKAGDGDAISEHQFEIAYRRGDPATGNIGAFALNTIPETNPATEMGQALSQLSVISLTNIITAKGGRRAVGLETARRLIPESIRHPALERCVTPDDYRRAAQNVEGVAQAAAVSLGGIFNTISVLIAPEEGEAPSDALIARTARYLNTLRMSGRELVVGPPQYAPLDIALQICPAGRAAAADIRAQVRAALVPEGGPRGVGFFHRSNTRFGADIRLADILSTIQALPLVGAVKARVFRPLFDAERSAVLDVIALGPTEIAQFEADDSHVEKGRLSVEIEDASSSPTMIVSGPAPEPVEGGAL